MRNVNKEGLYNFAIYLSGFILTMRNVNKEAVYKVLHGADSFILTMRNVNISELIGEKKIDKVLY